MALGVFIGFRRNNSALAKSLEILLNSCGVNTWLFNSDLITADNFDYEINRQIKLKADGSIFLLDEEVLESKYMMDKEIPWAVSQLSTNKYRLFPILINSPKKLIERTVIPKEIEYQEINTENFSSENLIAEHVVRSLLRTHRLLQTIKIRAFDRGDDGDGGRYLLNCNFGVVLEDLRGNLKFSWNKLIESLELQYKCISKEVNSRRIRLSARLRYTTAFLLGYTYRKSTGFKFS
ncbi:MAG: toll/interleukin-1 receptor domain-containing protein, partial [Candidatus Heimdallarchaeota archaeon]|nr:toll/interleukin-1 receptor domain-containing protein [Candidatus Heimdallarchaeota archaeon]